MHFTTLRFPVPVRKQTSQQPSSHNVPDAVDLKETIAAFKQSLEVSPERACEIERGSECLHLV